MSIRKSLLKVYYFPSGKGNSLLVSLFIFIISLLILASVFKPFSSWRSNTVHFSENQIESLRKVRIISGIDTVELHRSEAGWFLNSGLDVREKGVSLLIESLKRLRSAGPAPSSLLVDRDSSEVTKIELRFGFRRINLSIWSDKSGSISFIQKGDRGEVMLADVIGYTGNAESLFIAKSDYWKRNLLFNYPVHQIEYVNVLYKDNSDESFLIKQNTPDSFFISPVDSENSFKSMNDSLAIRYFSNFFYVPFERFANSEELSLLDSLIIAEPDYRIRVGLFNGSVVGYEFYRIKVGDNEGDIWQGFDPYRIHALNSSYSEMVVVNYYSIDLLLRKLSYFGFNR